MEKNIKGITNLKKMHCKKCGKERIDTETGICVICAPKVIHGREIECKETGNPRGTEVKSFTGKIDENVWMTKIR